MVDQSITEAMYAHSHLNLYGAIQGMLESGCLYGSDNGSAKQTAQKIIDLCKAEQQRQLTKMDKATGRLA